MSGSVLAVRWTLVAVLWPLVLLGCIVGAVRARVRESTRRLVSGGRDSAVVNDIQTREQLEKESQAMRQDPRGQFDNGMPQTAPFWVGQRIHNENAGLGVVIAVQAKDAADPRGCMPGGRWWEVVVEFDEPYLPRARTGCGQAVRTWTWNVLADRYGRCSRSSYVDAA